MGLVLVRVVGMPLLLSGWEVGHGGETVRQVGPQRLGICDKGEAQGRAHIDQGYSGQGINWTTQRICTCCGQGLTW